MACVGVSQATTLGVEDGVEAGDEHVGGDASKQRLINPLKYLPWRGGPQGLGYCPKHRAACAHHQSRWHTLTSGVPHDEAYPAIFEFEEVVEVSSHLLSRLIEGIDLPAFEFGHLLGE